VGRYEPIAPRRDRLDPALPTGLILGGMGGPDGPTAVAPFLRNLFRDPAVLPLPWPLSRLVGHLIVRRRLDKVRQRYAAISPTGGSPQLGWTRQQCTQLAHRFADRGITVHAAPAMRYWHPFAVETVEQLLYLGARQFLFVPAYPQYSYATTGTIMRAVREKLAEMGTDSPLCEVPDWHLLPGYLAAISDQAARILTGWAESGIDPATCALLYTAHSLPERFIRGGDPYLAQTRASVAAAHQILSARMLPHGDWWRGLPGGPQPLLGFQSKVGPVRWLSPATTSLTSQLAARGCSHLLVVPVSFTCEHIETLHELDLELAQQAHEEGIGVFERTPALNLDQGWLDSLSEHLLEAAFGRERADDGR
jgi:ferrochelatase